MVDRADLEKITEKLAQAEAILAYSGGVARPVTGVRTLLRALQSNDMPTAAARSLWIETVEAMLRLTDDKITVEEVRNLHRQIGELRKAIRTHLDRTPD
jgi:hypothetical protein